jgi:hypothetical protein
MRSARVRRRSGRGRRPRLRRNDPRLLLPALAISLVVFLVATSHRTTAPSPGELPTPSAPTVGLGRPEPTTARLKVGDLLQVQVAGRPGDRYGTVISQSDDRPVLEVLGGDESTPPLLRGVSRGTVVVTVLLEPTCPPEGVCRQYRQNLGAVRVTVDP